MKKIHINLKLTEAGLSSILSISVRVLRSFKVYDNGKCDNPRITSAYQQTLALTEKLQKKRMQIALNPPKKKTFNMRFTYPEAYYLSIIIERAIDVLPEEVVTFLRKIQLELEKNL